tara:strand:- start:16411 stop:16872 length:462 start_codon:yes stop_codon:yes gene_type:complete
MDKSLVGILLIIVGFAVMFFVWTQLLKSRENAFVFKPDSITPEPENKTKTELSRGFDHVLAKPGELNQASGKSEYPFESLAPEIVEHAVVNSPENKTIELADEIAETHLSIAARFFDTGDFEGATDMAELVVENESASPAQINRAKKLIEISA